MSKCSSENSNSSFVFGLIIGAIIGAIIAIVIYRKNKGKIFDDLQKKLEKFFKNLLKQEIVTPEVSVSENKKTSVKHKKNKIITVSTTKIETPPPITFIRKPAPKTFIKPKK